MKNEDSLEETDILSLKVAGKVTANEAEINAIAIAFLTLPNAAQVTLRTDNAIAASALQHNKNKSKIAKQVEWVKDLLKDKLTTLKIIQIPRGTDETHRKVDMATKTAKNKLAVTKLKIQPTRNSHLFFKYHKHTVHQNIREAIKTHYLNKHTIDWCLMERNKEILPLYKNIDWKASIQYMRNNKITAGTTSRTDHNKRAYKLKTWTKELATFEKLNNRRPDLYTSNTCIRCNTDKEDHDHIFRCPKNTSSLQLHLINVTTNTLQSYKKHSRQWVTQWLKNTTFQKVEEWVRLLSRNLIPKDFAGPINSWAKTNKIMPRLPITKITNEIQDMAQNIWKERCEKVIQWEKQHGITKAQKRAKDKWSNTHLKKTKTPELTLNLRTQRHKHFDFVFKSLNKNNGTNSA